MSRILLFICCAIYMADTCVSQGSRSKRAVMAGSFSSAGAGAPGLFNGMSMGTGLGGMTMGAGMNGMSMGSGMSMGGGSGMGMASGMTNGMGMGMASGMGGFGNFGNLMTPFRSLFAAQNHAAQNSNYFPVFQQQIATLIAQQQEAMARIPYAFPNFNGQGGYQGSYQGSQSSGHKQGQAQGQSQGQYHGQGMAFPPFSGVFTGAAVNLGPRGGVGQAASFPGGHDGLGVRIAQEFPAPSGGGGGGFGVFTSSSSGMSDVNGKKVAFKTSTFGTNDNGKITFKTLNE